MRRTRSVRQAPRLEQPVQPNFEGRLAERLQHQLSAAAQHCRAAGGVAGHQHDPDARLTAARVRRKLIDSTYTEGTVPATQESKLHVAPSATQEAQLAAARQTAKMVAEAKETLDKTLRRSAQSAVNEEMTVARQQLDAQLHDAVERAIKVSMERVSESAGRRLVQQAAERTAAIIEEARKASEVNTNQLDAKIRQAVDSAVNQATQQAAQQAAQQATVQNLKHAVEEAVERLLVLRELRQQHLEGDAALDRLLDRFVDRAHATGA